MGGTFQAWHWLVVAALAVVLFGAKRLPDAARGLGRSMRILKSELKHDDSAQQADQSTAHPAAVQPASAQLPAAPPPVAQPHTAAHQPTDQRHTPPAPSH